MQRISRSDRSAGRRHHPQLSAGYENAGGFVGDTAPSPVARLAPSFVQALPSLEGLLIAMKPGVNCSTNSAQRSCRPELALRKSGPIASESQ
jgi:hypothetical protein